MNRNTLILLGVLVILIAAAVFLLQRPGESSLSETERDLLLELDSASVNTISIVSASSSMALARKDLNWFLDQPVQAPADPAVVGNLLHEAATLRINSLISSKSEKHSLFQVDSSGTRITFSQASGESVSLVLGKTGPSFTDVYARRDGSNDVVLVTAGISYTSNRPLKEWRDHAILRLPAGSVQEIGFRYGDTTFALARKDSIWMIGTNPVLEPAVAGLVNGLSNLRADDFLDTPPPQESKLVATISVSGIQIRWLHAQGNDRYLVQTSLSSQWFQVDQWKAQQVLKRKKDLISG